MSVVAILFYVLTLALGAATVLAGAAVTGRHPYRFLSLFRMFLMVYVLYIFLFFAGQIFLLESGATTSGNLYLFYQAMSVLAEPAWSVFVFLLLSWAVALVGWTVPQPIRWGYWFLQAGLYGVTFYVLAVHQGSEDPRAVRRLGQAVDVVFHAIVYGALLVLLVGAVRGRGRSRRALAGRMGLAYLAGFAVATTFTFAWLPWDTDLRTYLITRACLYFLVNAAPLVVLAHYLARNRLEDLGDEGPAGRALVWEELTLREHEIVPLVAEGLTNEEIAERLFISAKTVKNNISNIYRKLGIRNRVELSNRYRQTASGRAGGGEAD